MSSKKVQKIFYYLLLLCLIVVLSSVVVYFNVRPGGRQLASGNSSPAATPNPTGTSTAEKLVNKKGQDWGPLPMGDFQFSVASAADKPIRFVSGEINPPDVHVGDQQALKIVLTSANGVARVVAQIGTDHGVKILELKKTSDMATNGLPASPLYSPDGKTFALRGAGTSSAGTDPFINAADASDFPKEAWEGNWTVADTHDTYYNTTFVAYDTKGNSNQLVLAWSDMCGLPTNGTGTLSQNCAATGVDGVDNGDLDLNNKQLTLVSGVLAWNPGRSIKIDGGTIIATSTGQMKQVYLCYTDADGDHYPAGGAFTSAAADCGGGSSVRKDTLISTAIDCNDGDGSKYQYWDGYPDADNDGYSVTGVSLVHNAVCGGSTFPIGLGYASTYQPGDCHDDNSHYNPASTGGYTSTIFGGTQTDHPGDWDFNCDGSVTKVYNTIGVRGTCSSSGAPGYYCSESGQTTGWAVATVPACGATAGIWTAGECSDYNGSGNTCPSFPPASRNQTQACY